MYEFRASNPRALNVLEGSGVFSTYKLQINYRSKQEILDFANVALQNIEANQYANIQLQANSLTPVTEKSFTDAVNFKYQRLGKINDLKDALPGLFIRNVKPYLDQKLAAKEQTAFLAFTRQTVKQFEKILTHLYPDKKIVSIMPERMHNTTIFSEFIRKYWDEVNFVQTKNMVPVIANMIVAKLAYLVRNAEKMLTTVQKLIAQWQTEDGPTIADWQRQVGLGSMTQSTFLDLLKENMLNFEIRNNAIKQALLSQRNEDRKLSGEIETADFILSTIHSAKGLEWDNVVVLYRNESDLEEDKKRMYYVAFTRAKQSEFILAYDTAASPRIEADYELIVTKLHQKHPDPNSKVGKPKNPHAFWTALDDVGTPGIPA